MKSAVLVLILSTYFGMTMDLECFTKIKQFGFLFKIGKIGANDFVQPWSSPWSSQEIYDSFVSRDRVGAFKIYINELM